MQPAMVASMLPKMKEDLLADNLDTMYGIEYAIEQVAQDALNMSCQVQLSGQA